MGIGAISRVLVGCIGIGFAVAGGTVSEDNLYLGVGENATRVSLPRDVDDVQVAFAADASESGLAQASPRDVSAGVARIQEEPRPRGWPPKRPLGWPRRLGSKPSGLPPKRPSVPA